MSPRSSSRTHPATQKFVRKIDKVALGADLLKLLGFTVLFVLALLLTACWAGGLPPAGL